MRRLSWLLVFGALLSHPVLAAPTRQMTLGDLQAISAGSDDSAANSCKFYILGVTEGATLVVGNKRHFCIPEGVTSSTMASVVKKLMAVDLAEFPVDHAMPAVSFVTAAMLHAYPCPISN